MEKGGTLSSRAHKQIDRQETGDAKARTQHNRQKHDLHVAKQAFAGDLLAQAGHAPRNARSVTAALTAHSHGDAGEACVLAEVAHADTGGFFALHIGKRGLNAVALVCDAHRHIADFDLFLQLD